MNLTNSGSTRRQFTLADEIKGAVDELHIDGVIAAMPIKGVEDTWTRKRYEYI